MSVIQKNSSQIWERLKLIEFLNNILVVFRKKKKKKMPFLVEKKLLIIFLIFSSILTNQASNGEYRFHYFLFEKK